MTTTVLLAGFAVLAGALVQGAVGYGMNLIAAPLLALIEPALIPGPLLMVTTWHALAAVLRERHDTDWRGVGWITIGRLPGTVLGIVAVATLAQRPFTAVVGVAVLVCVLLSVTSWRPVPARAPLLLAGMASGTLGTAATIGGPPLALLYQHSPGPTIRSTMAACLGLGSVVSVGGLAVAGQIDENQLVLAAWLLPFLAVGFLLSNPARRLLDAGNRTRIAVLSVSAASALVLLVRSTLG